MVHLVCPCESLIREAGWVDVAHAGDLGICDGGGGGEVWSITLASAVEERTRGLGWGWGWDWEGLGVVGAGWLICPLLTCLHAAWTDNATNQAGCGAVITAPRRDVRVSVPGSNKPLWVALDLPIHPVQRSRLKFVTLCTLINYLQETSSPLVLFVVTFVYRVLDFMTLACRSPGLLG